MTTSAPQWPDADDTREDRDPETVVHAASRSPDQGPPAPRTGVPRPPDRPTPTAPTDAAAITGDTAGMRSTAAARTTPGCLGDTGDPSDTGTPPEDAQTTPRPVTVGPASGTRTDKRPPLRVVADGATDGPQPVQGRTGAPVPGRTRRPAQAQTGLLLGFPLRFGVPRVQLR
jgi:hypothetical protein